MRTAITTTILIINPTHTNRNMKKLLITLVLIFVAGIVSAQTYSKELEKSAKKGDPVAQKDLGVCYLEGKGTKQDIKKAYKWLSESLEQGNADAMYYIALMADRSLLSEASVKIPAFKERGGSSEQRYARYMYKKAAELDQPNALIWLGRDFDAINENKLAFDCYKKAADAGNGEAQYLLGYMYYYGLGTSTNLGEAKRLFTLAAENGREEALAMVNEIREKREKEIRDSIENVRREEERIRKEEEERRLAAEREIKAQQDKEAAKKWEQMIVGKKYVSENIHFASAETESLLATLKINLKQSYKFLADGKVIDIKEMTVNPATSNRYVANGIKERTDGTRHRTYTITGDGEITLPGDGESAPITMYIRNNGSFLEFNTLYTGSIKCVNSSISQASSSTNGWAGRVYKTNALTITDRELASALNNKMFTLKTGMTLTFDSDTQLTIHFYPEITDKIGMTEEQKRMIYGQIESMFEERTESYSVKNGKIVCEGATLNILNNGKQLSFTSNPIKGTLNRIK